MAPVWEAVQHHRSQLPGYQKLAALPEKAHERLWDVPYYRVFSRVSVPGGQENDLFGGLRGAKPVSGRTQDAELVLSHA